ncbi:MAG: beta-ketoacyl-ACP synthase II [Anaerolineae bacterium]|nr:beta-ketoacyl-ACP synthase II [Anaerolineae bacterium]MDX9828666.1 beta-ketoacyl-ACP synthase II [Anaerolineae bacterium]
MKQRDIAERVVITGMGAVTPLGLSVQESWEGMVAGRSGISTITLFDASDLPIRIAGELKGFDVTEYLDIKEARRMARSSHLALAAGIQAMADAGLGDQVPNPERAGVVMGTGIGGFDAGLEGWDTYKAKGLRRVNPFTAMALLCNMPAHHLSLRYQCQAYNSTVVTACASGTQAIGEATEAIRRGAADLMLAGGVEGMIHPVLVGAFIVMRVLAADNDSPEKAIKPFDARRDGFVCSEGSAVMVLERLDHALERGARIYAEVLGYAANTDAYHVAIPDPEGAGAVRCMRWALEDAGVEPAEIDYINAHGPGTEVGDPAETRAIKTLFGEHAYRVPISSTKSMVGHALGGAGAIEGMACVKTIETGIIHPTINYEVPDPECDLDYVPNVARKAGVRTTLSNSFGLGGQNACLVLSKIQEQAA